MTFGRAVDSVPFPMKHRKGIATNERFQTLGFCGGAADAFETLRGLDANNGFVHFIAAVRGVSIWSNGREAPAFSGLNENSGDAQFRPFARGGTNGQQSQGSLEKGP